MRIPEQIRRLAVVVGLIVGGVLVFRFLIVPPSLVSMESHRSSTVARELVKPVSIAGSDVCQACHDDESIRKNKGYHRNLSCEGCHGPAAKHTEDPSLKPFAPRERKFCPLCHAYDASRPTGFPQINPTTHNPLQACITCHDPHDPVPPTTPKACSACHAHIERTKAVSRHALLECTTCHKVPEAHKTTPRAVTPSKPQVREFCGNCHGTGAAEKRAPKVDLSDHGGRSLCWQCHYPHLPGGA